MSGKTENGVALQFEQALFERSPFGLTPTALGLFAALFGSFLLIGSLEHVALFRIAGRHIAFAGGAWSALVLSLLCCTALVMQRYSRVAEARDAADYAKILAGGLASAKDITALVPGEARFRRATLIGIATGLVIAALVRWSEIREGNDTPLFTAIWYCSATVFLSVLFSRGVEQTRAGFRSYSRVLNSELKIDLLRTDTLSVLGRSAARTALIWFVVSAVGCLFFVGGDLNWLTVLLTLGCAAMGIAMFASITGRIHRLILAAKKTELENIRCRIDALRDTLHEDAFASAKLHGLLAYEKRVLDAPEWPFDQNTAVRVGASALILTVPWFGQAVAAYLVEHLGHIGG